MGNYLYTIIYFLSNIVDIYIMYMFMNAFLEKKKISKNVFFLGYLFFFLVGFCQYLYAPYAVLNIIINIIGYTLITFLYQDNLVKRIVTAILYFICGIISEMIVAIIVGFSGFDVFEKKYNASYITLILMELVLWIIVKIMSLFSKKKRNFPMPKIFTIFIFITTISILGLETIVFEQDQIVGSVKVMTMAFTLLIIILIAYLYDILAKNFEEKINIEIANREKSYYLNQAELLQQSYNEIRKLKHDMKNHIIALEALEKSGNSEKVLKYLENMSQKMRNTSMYSNTGITVLDGIINYKLTLAEKMDVKITTDMEVPTNLSLEEDDIVIIMGNILDNAIEANKYVKENRYIDLKMNYRKGNLVIILKNSYDGMVAQKEESYITRKKDKKMHGIGLRSVNNIVEQYHGVMESNHNEKEFEIKIMIYMDAM